MTASVGWSLIVPSYNGSDTLPACLEALADVRPPSEGLEIIVVDNASSDGTSDLLRSFAERTGALFLSEPRRGKSFALNHAIERARGDFLIFLDDDIIPVPGLAEAYAQAAAAFPAAGVFAGQLRPSWRAVPPAWLADLANEGMCCGCTPDGRAAGWIAPIETKGGNMCVRRSLMGNTRFAVEGVNFGASKIPVGGLDTEFAGRVSTGGSVRFVPDALAEHIIQPHEMTWGAIYRRYLRIGRGNAAQGRARYGIFQLALRAAVRAALAATSFGLGRRSRAAWHGIHLAMRMGALDYKFRLQHPPESFANAKGRD